MFLEEYWYSKKNVVIICFACSNLKYNFCINSWHNSLPLYYLNSFIWNFYNVITDNLTLMWLDILALITLIFFRHDFAMEKEFTDNFQC